MGKGEPPRSPSFAEKFRKNKKLFSKKAKILLLFSLGCDILRSKMIAIIIIDFKTITHQKK